MSETIDINELVQDDHNFNKGTPKGQGLLEKSFEELGAGRSILVDKDNRIIAGNKSQKAAAKKGIKKVIVVETDGTELVAVKRTDVELDSAMGRKLALADNTTASVNLSWDGKELQAVASDSSIGFDPQTFGMDFSRYLGVGPEKQKGDLDLKKEICPKCGHSWYEE